MNSKDKLSILVEITNIIKKEGKTLDIFTEISTIARDITNSDRCSLYLYDKEKGDLYTTIAQGLKSDIRVKIGEGIAGFVAQSEMPLVDNDIKKSMLFKNTDAQTGYETKKMLTVPILGSENELYGVLQVLNKLDGNYTREDQEFLQVVGEFIVSYIESNERKRILEERVEEKTKELREINENLSELVDEKLQELRQKDAMMVQQSKNAAMGEMISMIAHQWRQPLSSMSAISSRIKLESQLGEVEDIQGGMQEIIELSQYLSDTIDDFRNYFKPTIDRVDTKLSDILERSIRFTSHYLITNDIEVIEDVDDITLHVIRNDIIQVFINLLKNSIDAFVENRCKKRCITIKATRSGDMARIVFSDTAGGISDAIIEKIFDEYFTTKDDKGTGLGLYMSKMIIESRYGGSFSVSSSNDETHFTLLLPIK